jgi:hypothetical protein
MVLIAGIILTDTTKVTGFFYHGITKAWSPHKKGPVPTVQTLYHSGGGNRIRTGE